MLPLFWEFFSFIFHFIQSYYNAIPGYIGINNLIIFKGSNSVCSKTWKAFTIKFNSYYFQSIFFFWILATEYQFLKSTLCWGEISLKNIFTILEPFSRSEKFVHYYMFTFSLTLWTYIFSFYLTFCLRTWFCDFYRISPMSLLLAFCAFFINCWWKICSFSRLGKMT